MTGTFRLVYSESRTKFQIYTIHCYCKIEGFDSEKITVNAGCGSNKHSRCYLDRASRCLQRPSTTVSPLFFGGLNSIVWQARSADRRFMHVAAQSKGVYYFEIETSFFKAHTLFFVMCWRRRLINFNFNFQSWMVRSKRAPTTIQWYVFCKTHLQLKCIQLSQTDLWDSYISDLPRFPHFWFHFWLWSVWVPVVFRLLAEKWYGYRWKSFAKAH